MALIELYTNGGLLNYEWTRDRDEYYRWCQENCKEWFSYDALSLSVRWNFKHEADAVAFKLRWL